MTTIVGGGPTIGQGVAPCWIVVDPDGVSHAATEVSWDAPSVTRTALEGQSPERARAFTAWIEIDGPVCWK